MLSDATTTLGERGIRSTTWTVVGGLVPLLAMVSVATVVGRATVAAAVSDLDNRVPPARDAADELAKTYVDQETGQRGFLIHVTPSSRNPTSRDGSRARG